MPIQNCPIEIPEGWEFVRYGVPKHGEHLMAYGGEPSPARHDFNSEWIVIRRAKQPLEVGDWVRVVHPGGRADGERGVVHYCPSSVPGSYLGSIEGVGDLFYQRDALIKQARTVKPYTIDQCIAEIAKRGSRDVIRGGSKSEIETIYKNGVSTKGPHIGFVSYGAAVKAITWPNGDAFGNVTWEDAE